MKRHIVVLVGLACLAPRAFGDEASQQRAEIVVRQSFSQASPEEWATRLQQDEVQVLCSRYRDNPPPQIAERILRSQQKTIKYPEDGKLMGHWSEGEKLASIGTGGHIGRIQPDPPDRKKGGNCYACHMMAPKELAAGTIGPSLTGYGKLRGSSPEVVKYTYERIYNPQAFTVCSMMPRFGHNGWLTPKQIADAVAFLLDPESPVNK
jgi:sulfur-oxidizing protein SoxX